MEIHTKIKRIIDEMKLNNNSFAKLIGVTSTTIDSITIGRLQSDGDRKRTKPGFDLLQSIITHCNVNPDYFFGDSDEIFTNKTTAEVGLNLPKIITVNEDGEENINFVGVKARAGYLDGYSDPEYMESLPSFSMPMLKNGTYRCFEIKGNSMSTTIHDGDYLFGKYVDNFDDILDGRIYVIISKNDGVVVKRVLNRIRESGKLILKSDNRDGNYPMYSIYAEDILEVWYASMYASKQMPDPINIYEKIHDLESKFYEMEETLRKKLN
ncbi:XRE family transcriptional regulator [Flavobacterium pectinovorum]|uniref:Transcriptional regulator n=1 Tax=Flavobacterium pectinovorum TaxID=29533 RepID=A0A502F0M5_9FLAO|nr:S24 family peptidase [Flavobacterium pectinovorum]TPG41981.1 transcriptional regulator [Flavobacterium pectinovorum]